MDAEASNSQLSPVAAPELLAEKHQQLCFGIRE